MNLYLDLFPFSPQISCATYNRDIANATVELIRKGSSGIYNCVGPEPLSKYDWAMLIVSFYGLIFVTNSKLFQLFLFAEISSG